MSKLILSLLIGSVLFSACRKSEHFTAVEPSIPCELQTANPSGRSYNTSSVVEYVCNDKHCGILPLSTKNYWVYQDSIFNNGSFVKIQFDTLRYSVTKKSMTDGLVWWEGNISVGLPSLLYANETAFYTLTDRAFSPETMDARSDYMMPEGDSVKYLASFDDIAASGRSVRLSEPVTTIGGNYNGCILFEKNARYFRRDQVFYKPGIGVVRYTLERAGSDRVFRYSQVSTLVAFHIE